MTDDIELYREIDVRCANSSCGRETSISRSGTESEWEIVVSTDSPMSIDEAYCPEHRLSDTIDSLIETARRA